MSLLPLLVCIKNFIYPFIMLNHLFLSPFVNNLLKNGIKLWREEKMFDVHCATHTFISIPMSLIKLILTTNSTHPTAIHVMI
jgi:hypothetical protein